MTPQKAPQAPRTPDHDPVGPGVFLDRRIYRRRRLVDALRALPVVALVLFVVPMLITQAGAPVQTAPRLAYIIVAWAALILCVAMLNRRLFHGASSDPEEEALEDAELVEERDP